MYYFTGPPGQLIQGSSYDGQIVLDDNRQHEAEKVGRQTVLSAILYLLDSSGSTGDDGTE
tara:strand:- start:851 stop:1030 length:180 start_codon:yes stop_codon:yes gene_type:complete